MAIFEGFIGPAYQAPSIYQDAQELINWYPEVDPTKESGERGVIALYPTDGLSLIAELPAASEVRGLWVLPGAASMIAVSGSIVYLIDSSFGYSQVGTLASFSGQVSICDNGIEAMLADGINRYSYTIASGLFSILPTTDGAFTGAGRVDCIDGFLIYNDPNSSQWGCTDNLASTSPQLSFSSKFSSSDYLITLIADHREAFLIGERTTEVWVNVGTFPFPFAIVPGTSMQHGCAAIGSIARLGESSAWLAKDTRGQSIIIQMVGYQPKRISTHAVESDIESGIVSDAIAFTYQREGHEFYMLTFPTQDKTWCYDLTTQLWHKRAYRDNANILHRHPANCHAFFQGINVVGDYQNGNLYNFTNTVYTDNGQPIIRIRRSPHITESLLYITYDQLQIQFQPGVGLPTGQGSAPQMMLRWSDDGGSTWSAYYYLPIGAIGQYKNRAIKRMMGRARDRVFEVSITDPVWAVIVSADIVFSVGSN